MTDQQPPTPESPLSIVGTVSNSNVTNPETEEEKQKKLTIKQRKWLKAYIETGNATEAARLAGYDCDNEISFRVIGFENLTKLNVAELMEEKGLTNNYLLEKIKEGIDKPVKVERVQPYAVKNADGTERLQSTVVTPDYWVRAKFLEIALKVKKLLTNDDKKVNNQINAESVNVQVINYGSPEPIAQPEIPENNAQG